MSEVVIRVSQDGRTPAMYVAPTRSRQMSVEIGNEARALRHSHPDLHQHVIAVILGVNPGRVSNALNGWWSKRFPHSQRKSEIRPGVFRGHGDNVVVLRAA